ncbi:MAG TPA: DUF368 domain-containing protein [Clostridiales bacterium]|nr:DUF368 domain-containing protein [Clostridiales bacterium]
MKTYNQTMRAILQTFLYGIMGVLAGGGAILPGISGGVICVIFGLYQPMMEFLSSPRVGVKKYYKLFIPVCIGWAVGFYVFSKLVAVMLTASYLFTTWLFCGLILGSYPSLYREAGKQGRNRSSGVWFLLGLVVLLIPLAIVKAGILPQVQPTLFWYFFCGVLWGFSLIVPGMTSSSILMSLGLFTPLNQGISSLDPEVLIPWLIGLVLVILLFSKLVTYLFRVKYALFYHVVLGLLVASTLVIIPTEGYHDVWHGLLSLLLCGLGAVCTFYLDSRKE